MLCNIFRNEAFIDYPHPQNPPKQGFDWRFDREWFVARKKQNRIRAQEVERILREML